ncbi:MAG TPA: zinc-binding dehydrogenase [Bacillota bacterium]|nr:zinc-binding dehydrogenase [Bacillota bacterium]
MKAFVHEYGELKIKDVDEPVARDGEVVVSLKTAGLNRRDLYIPHRLGDDRPALILGSDGAGVVDSVGKGVTHFSVGDEVIINPALHWDKKSVAPPEDFAILGMPDDGTFAEKIAISAEQVEKKPAYLSWDEAGALALAALTGYRALFTKGQVKKGETVFIPGAGSGVATYLVAFAKAYGARVIATSRSKIKQEKVKQLGADVVIDTNRDWTDALKEETVDLVIDSIGRATFNRSLDILKKGGRFVVFGATTDDNVDLNLRKFFYGQYQLIGSTMGSREELREMLTFIQKQRIHPIVDRTYTLEEAQTAFDDLENFQPFGKIVLRING